tara:strand:- start:2302 stop:3231 length:930 start_codon:yes stop_codon:yes gene_type:complete
MARPQRNNVDYFPFICEEGTKMFYIEETYGNDGFAVFVKLLRELARADNHYLDLSKKSTKMFLSAKCKVSVGVLEAIVTDLVELEKFDTELWNENSIVWCQSFVDSIQDAYSKRSNNCIDRNSLLLLLGAKGIRKPLKSTPKPSLDKPKGDVNPQSKVKDTIEEEKIEEETKLPVLKPKLKTKTVFSDEINNLYDRVLPLFPIQSSKSTPAQNEKKEHNWKDELRKLIEIDEIDAATIEHVIRSARSNVFWSKNFCSLMKLRTKDQQDVKYIDVFINKFKQGNNNNYGQQQQLSIEASEFASTATANGF